MATIKMPDNQSFELDDEIAKDDNLLRGALKVGYPDAANATFERTGGKNAGWLMNRSRIAVGVTVLRLNPAAVTIGRLLKSTRIIRCRPDFPKRTIPMRPAFACRD